MITRQEQVRAAMSELARASVLFQVCVREALNTERTLEDRHEFAALMKRWRIHRDKLLAFLTPAEKANL